MFANHPIIQCAHQDRVGRRWYVLSDDLVCRLTLNGGDWVMVVPLGFYTDGASVPRLFWWLYPPMGAYYRAAILHDYLYSRACTCSRFLADAVFRDAMRADGVPVLRRVIMYYAVRLFAWGSFRKR